MICRHITRHEKYKDNDWFSGLFSPLIIFHLAYSHPNNLLLMYLSGQKEQGLIDCSYLSEHYISDLSIPDGFEFYNMIAGGCREIMDYQLL